MSKSRDIADSAATINYIDGLTSDAQTQLDGKSTLDGSPTFTGTVTATAFSGDGSSLTGVDSLPSQTGNAGEFLTTDGTNASWGTVSAGGSITATASGSITAGDALVFNSDGTVSSITSTYVDDYTNFTFAVMENMTNGANAYGTQAKYIYSKDEKRNRYYFLDNSTWPNTTNKFYKFMTNGFDEKNRPYVRYEYLSNRSGNDWVPHQIAVDQKQDKFLMVGYDTSSNNLKYFSGYVSDEGFTMASGTYGANFPDNGNYAMYGMHWNKNNEQFTCLYRSNSNTKIASYYIDENSPNALFGASAYTAISGFSQSQPNLCNMFYSEADDCYIVVYNDNNNLKVKVITYSGTVFTIGAEYTFYANNSSSRPIYVDYCDSQSCYIFGYENTSGYMEVVAATLSGTTLTFGTPVVPSSTNITDTDWSFSVLNPSNEIIVFYNYYYRVGTISGTTISSFSSQINLGYSSYGGSFRTWCGNSFMDKNSGYLMGFSYYNMPFFGQIYSSNYDGYNFVGFAKDSVSDSESLDVTVISGINTNQTSLTTGNPYSVNVHGDLVNAKSFDYIGIATSATGLLVK